MGKIQWSLSAHVWVFVDSIDFLYWCSHCVPSWCLLRLSGCLLCHGSGEVFAPICFAFPELFDHGHSWRSRGFWHPGGFAATHHVLGSCAILEQRIGRHSHSTPAPASGGLPFRPERRGRGAPSVAMKWRDAVKTATMRGPLPPDSTPNVPHWWQPGTPLLRPTDYMAPVPLKCKRVTSAEPKTDPAKRAHMRVPDEAKLWFVDFHAYHARVHG